MTSMFSPGRVRRSVRTACALSAAGLAVVAVSGCEKPAPVVTLTAGSTSVHSDKMCNNDGKALDDKGFQKCAENATFTSIDLSSQQTLRFGVDPEIAERGWEVITVVPDPESQQQRVEQLVRYTNKTYATTQNLDLSVLPDKAEVFVVERDNQDDASKAYGVWNFRINKES